MWLVRVVAGKEDLHNLLCVCATVVRSWRIFVSFCLGSFVCFMVCLNLYSVFFNASFIFVAFAAPTTFSISSIDASCMRLTLLKALIRRSRVTGPILLYHRVHCVRHASIACHGGRLWHSGAPHLESASIHGTVLSRF